MAHFSLRKKKASSIRWVEGQMLQVHFAEVLSAFETPPVKALVIQDLRCPINFFQPPAKSRCRRRLKAKCLINIKFIRFSITESIVKLKKQLILRLLCIPLLWSLICDIKSPTVKILQLYYTCLMVRRQREKGTEALKSVTSIDQHPKQGKFRKISFDQATYTKHTLCAHSLHLTVPKSSDRQTTTGHLWLKAKQQSNKAIDWIIKQFSEIEIVKT